MLRAVVLAAILVGPAVAHAGRPMCRPGAKYHGAPIDLDVKGADIHDVMRLLADVANVNIVIADNVRGKVTLRLTHAPWDLVACTIAAMHELEVTVHHDIVLVKK